MNSDSGEDPGRKAIQICQDVQHMIDINSEHLERLRLPMPSTSGEKIFNIRGDKFVARILVLLLACKAKDFTNFKFGTAQ